MIGSLLVGFGLGLQHATDSDHIVAVTALASESSSVRRSALTGALWGLGHLMTLFVVGGALILLGVRMSPRMDCALELLVALVLIWLGVHTIRRCFTGRFHFHFHGHAGHSHSHLHFHSKTEPGHRHDAHACQARSRGLSLWPKSLMVGLAHGLAGSGGLALAGNSEVIYMDENALSVEVLQWRLDPSFEYGRASFLITGLKRRAVIKT